MVVYSGWRPAALTDNRDRQLIVFVYMTCVHIIRIRKISTTNMQHCFSKQIKCKRKKIHNMKKFGNPGKRLKKYITCQKLWRIGKAMEELLMK